MGETIRQGRWTAELDGDFVVFIIGARPNKFRLGKAGRLVTVAEAKGARQRVGAGVSA